MEIAIDYTLDLDHSVWIPVPLAFPWSGFSGAEEWSAALASSLLDGLGAGPTVTAQLQMAALSFATVESPLPGAVERFWHLPSNGGAECLAHLYIAELPEPTIHTLAELAVAGVDGFVQVFELVEVTAFQLAARAVAITSIHSEPIFVERYIGTSRGLVFIVEVIERNALILESLEEHLRALFRSIQPSH